MDEPGEVFPYGRFECDTTVAYRSVTLFGSIALVNDNTAKRQFFTRLMAKYAKPDWDRPRDFLPRLGQIELYAIAPERMTGKEIALPARPQRWPAVDRTRRRTPMQTAPQNPDHALVLFSGGQDSTTCLAWALARYAYVETIGFAYGQRHAVELECREPIRNALAALWPGRLGPDNMVDLSATLAALGSPRSPARPRSP